MLRESVFLDIFRRIIENEIRCQINAIKQDGGLSG